MSVNNINPFEQFQEVNIGNPIDNDREIKLQTVTHKPYDLGYNNIIRNRQISGNQNNKINHNHIY